MRLKAGAVSRRGAETRRGIAVKNEKNSKRGPGLAPARFVAGVTALFASLCVLCGNTCFSPPALGREKPQMPKPAWLPRRRTLGLPFASSFLRPSPFAALRVSPWAPSFASGRRICDVRMQNAPGSARKPGAFAIPRRICDAELQKGSLRRRHPASARFTRRSGASGHCPRTERGGEVLVAVPKPFPRRLGHRRPESFPNGGSVQMPPAPSRPQSAP
jgi:hypothetical protein